MDKFIRVLEKYFVPYAAKFGAQRHLVAVRDGFVALMPLIIIGSFAVLINSLPIPGYADMMKSVFGEFWKSFGGNLWNGTFAVMSLMLVFTISYNLAKSYGSDGLAAGVVSFACLLMLYTGSDKDWALPYAFLGPQGLFVAIFVALIATEILVKLMGNPKLVINMPDGVPPAVGKSFAALIPAMMVLVVFGLFKCACSAVQILNIHQVIFTAIQAPLSGLADQLSSAIIIALLNHLLWFFGLHGSNILEPLMQSIYIPAINANMAAVQAGQPIPYIVTKPFFDSFIYLGGSGASICMLLAIFIVAKSKTHKNIAKLGFAPGIFNINETVIFGLPIVLNPIFLIPFILTPVVLTIVSYFAIASGLVAKTIAMAPWTAPPIIGGLLVTGSISGAILALVNLVIGVAIYIPFIVIAEKQERNKGLVDITIDGKSKGA